MKMKIFAAMLLGLNAGVAMADIKLDLYNGWSVQNGNIVVPNATPYSSQVVGNVSGWNGSLYYSWQNRDQYTAVFNGYLNVATAGTYFFQTVSDDGIEVVLDGSEVINSPSIQWFGTATSNAIVLGAGSHSLQVRFYENGGNDGLVLRWRDIGSSSFSVVPTSALSVAAPVPEPETYAMLLAGLGVVGAIARRRKQK